MDIWLVIWGERLEMDGIGWIDGLYIYRTSANIDLRLAIDYAFAPRPLSILFSYPSIRCDERYQPASASNVLKFFLPSLH